MMTTTATDHTVRHFREVLFWPVQLMPLADGGSAQPHWKLLAQGGEGNRIRLPMLGKVWRHNPLKP